MNKEELEELQKYNLEYLEAQNSEEIFGGDYTSEVELEYVKKENNRLQQELERYKNIIDELEKWAIEYSQDLEFRCYMDTMLEKLQELKGE